METFKERIKRLERERTRREELELYLKECLPDYKILVEERLCSAGTNGYKHMKTWRTRVTMVDKSNSRDIIVFIEDWLRAGDSNLRILVQLMDYI